MKVFIDYSQRDRALAGKVAAAVDSDFVLSSIGYAPGEESCQASRAAPGKRIARIGP